MQKIKCAVIGVGYLGRFHAQKYHALKQSHLVGVCDIDKAAVKKVADELDVDAFTDYRDLFGKVDAVSIAATTNQHHQIAKDCINAGLHVLIEKPITETVEQAKELIMLAKKNKVKLQVGHLERFNSARLALDDFLEEPKFIESQRIAPFNPRGTDVNVILDLMIHDIDLIHSIVNAPIKHIDAQGAPILSKFIDIANARISFQNGCVANVTASRISFKSLRKTRIFQDNSYISIDYQNKKFAVFEKGEGEMFPGVPTINRHESAFENTDALLSEVKSFLEAIINDTTPLVTGHDGLTALDIAARITRTIKQNLKELEITKQDALELET